MWKLHLLQASKVAKKKKRVSKSMYIARKVRKIHPRKLRYANYAKI